MAVLVTATAALVTALHTYRRRKRYAAEIEPEMSAGLPQLPRAEALDILAHAEKAAIEKALGGPSTPNPHLQRTRAHILWEAQYGSTMLEWTDGDA